MGQFGEPGPSHEDAEALPLSIHVVPPQVVKQAEIRHTFLVPSVTQTNRERSQKGYVSPPHESPSLR